MRERSDHYDIHTEFQVPRMATVRSKGVWGRDSQPLLPLSVYRMYIHSI